MWGYYNQLQILLLTFLESGVIGGFFYIVGFIEGKDYWKKQSIKSKEVK